MSTNATAAALREFFAGLVAGTCRSIPPALYRLARRAAGSAAAGADVDLVSAFIEKTLTATRNGKAAGARGLLNLDDHALEHAVLHRLRQLHAEALPDRKLLKSLRACVRQTLADPLPVEATLPISLMERARLSTARVREAVAAVVQSGTAHRSDPKAISAVLMTTYFSAAKNFEEQAVDSEAPAMLDALRIAHQLERALEHPIRRAVAARAQGLELAEIARGERVATSTAHARVAAAVEGIRARCAASGWSREQVEPALALLTA